MSPRRDDRAAPPPIKGEWELRFGTNEAASGWEDLCSQAPGNTRTAYESLRKNPKPPQTTRCHRLKHDLASRTFKGRELEHWQYEVTGSGRIRYLPDDERRTVWIVYASPKHP